MNDRIFDGEDSIDPHPEVAGAIAVTCYYLVVRRKPKELSAQQLRALDEVVTMQAPQSSNGELLAWSAMGGGALEPLVRALETAGFGPQHLYPGIADSLEVSEIGGRIGGRFKPGDNSHPEHPERWQPLTPWLSGRWCDGVCWVSERKSP